MATYECAKCGMAVNAFCAKCETALENDYVTSDEVNLISFTRLLLIS